MADKKASPVCGGFCNLIDPFCLSILLYLMKLSYVSVNSGSLIPPTPFFGGILLSFLFPFLRSLPYTSLFPLWSHLSQFPIVRCCCHCLLHVTHPQSMLASFFSPYILPYNSKSELLCNSPESGFPIALSSIAYL